METENKTGRKRKPSMGGRDRGKEGGEEGMADRKGGGREGGEEARRGRGRRAEENEKLKASMQ